MMTSYFLLLSILAVVNSQSDASVNQTTLDTSATTERTPETTTVEHVEEGDPTTMPATPEDDNSTTTEEPSDDLFVDTTTFSRSMSAWDVRGWWGKFNLTHLEGGLKTVPDIGISEDHVVLINEVNPFTSLLRKSFPPMINGTLSITHFLKFTDIFIVGLTVNAVEKKQVTFLNATKNHWANRNYYWVTETFDIGDHETSFEIIFKAKTSSSALWAIDIITIRGIGDGSHSTNHSEIPPAVVPPSWHHNGTDSEDDDLDPGHTDDQEGKQEMTSIASSMWQAIYVFIALFLFVLVLFIILMIRQKRKKNIVESVPGTYDHRSSMPSAKPQDNMAYQTDSV